MTLWPADVTPENIRSAGPVRALSVFAKACNDARQVHSPLARRAADGYRRRRILGLASRVRGNRRATVRITVGGLCELPRGSQARHCGCDEIGEAEQMGLFVAGTTIARRWNCSRLATGRRGRRCR